MRVQIASNSTKNALIRAFGLSILSYSRNIACNVADSVEEEFVPLYIGLNLR